MTTNWVGILENKVDISLEMQSNADIHEDVWEILHSEALKKINDQEGNIEYRIIYFVLLNIIPLLKLNIFSRSICFIERMTDSDVAPMALAISFLVSLKSSLLSFLFFD
mgnify:CR=1 FL=1